MVSPLALTLIVILCITGGVIGTLIISGKILRTTNMRLTIEQAEDNARSLIRYAPKYGNGSWHKATEKFLVDLIPFAQKERYTGTIGTKETLKKYLNSNCSTHRNEELNKLIHKFFGKKLHIIRKSI